MIQGRCCAITKKGTQCSFNNSSEIPNIYKNLQGRPVLLCMIHYYQYSYNKNIKLIKDGILQPYNKYGFGSTVFDHLINWKEWEKNKTIAKVNRYWGNYDTH